LEYHLGDEAQQPPAGLVITDTDVVAGSEHELGTCPDLRRKRGDKPEDKDSEDPGLGGVH
jgi:hypothetical protein